MRVMYTLRTRGIRNNRVLRCISDDLDLAVSVGAIEMQTAIMKKVPLLVS